MITEVDSPAVVVTSTDCEIEEVVTRSMVEDGDHPVADGTGPIPAVIPESG